MTHPPIRKLIRQGFWIGIGFALPAIGFIQASNLIDIALIRVSLKERIASTVREATRGLQVADSLRVIRFDKVMTEDGETIIRGTLENTGAEKVSSFLIEAEFFDKDQRFLAECTDSVQVQIAPKGTENFQIKCGGRFGTYLPSYESLTVRVTSASAL